MVDQLLSAFGDKMIINSYRYAGGPTLLNGLLSWWTFDEAAGNSRADSHGSIILSEIGGNVTQGIGKISNSAQIDGADITRKLLNTSATAAFNPTGDWTIAGWVYNNSNLTSTNKTQRFFEARSSADVFAMSCGTAGANLDEVKFAFRTGSTDDITTTAELTGNDWNFILCQVDNVSNIISCYIDNGTPATGAIGGDHLATNKLAFGASITNDNTTLVGRLDEWGCWNRLLSADEKAELYNSGSGIGYPGP